jgi:hypothetical protein
MTRYRVWPIVALLVLAGCGGGATPTGGGATLTAPPAASTGGGSGSDIIAAAAALTDICPLMPMDLAGQLVPGAAAPQSQTFAPFRCTISNGTVTLEITLGAYDGGGPVSGAQAVPDLAAGGYFELLTPDNAYLTVLLTPDQGKLYVKLASQDGADHQADVVAVAKRVLAALSG